MVLSTDVTAITEINVLQKTNVRIPELYTELMLLKTKLMNTNTIMVSQIVHSKIVMKIIERLSDIDHI